MKESKLILPVSAIVTSLLGLLPLLLPSGYFVSYHWVGETVNFEDSAFRQIFLDYSGSYNPLCLIAWLLVLVGVALPLLSLIPYILGKKKLSSILLISSGGAMALGSFVYFFFARIAAIDSSYSVYRLMPTGYLAAISGILIGAFAIVMGILYLKGKLKVVEKE